MRTTTTSSSSVARYILPFGADRRRLEVVRLRQPLPAGRAAGRSPRRSSSPARVADDIQATVVQERRRRVRRAARRGPRDAHRCRSASPVRPRRMAISILMVCPLIANTRSSCCTGCGIAVLAEPRGLPEQRAGVEVVAADRLAVHDDLAAAVVRRDERRRPVVALGALARARSRGRSPDRASPGIRVSR